MDPIQVVVCDECKQALFVNGHPRNFCGHSNRGTLTEFVPRAVADELAETLEAYQSVVGYVPALAKYREAVERPDDDTYGQFNADGTPKRALRRTLEGIESTGERVRRRNDA